ncbi:isoprenyl transferase [Aquiluna borgnonia]|uniref:Isoprenyl transferase n=1 Tax=Aquiluna borgnonia TaxID=2499157 RepID=A0A7D4PQB0_9MICO|nr:isoprenyl transferase [Aquiluna borgnonia]
MRNVLYRFYEKKLESGLAGLELPKHIGVMVDGNRRWASLQGLGKAGHGHAAGAKKIVEFLGWCSDLDIKHVTLYLLSTDNLKGRDQEELADLIEIIVTLAEQLQQKGRWRLQLVGDIDALPEQSASRLREVQASTANNSGTHVNLAIAYGGRKEIADAMRSIVKKHAEQGASIEQLAEVLTPELITEHLYTGGQPDPDLLIRTSGEQRLSGFLLWQSANSEFYFAEALWPDFRRVDFLRALRDFQRRNRRFGS